ncbi:MAG TPA: AMP-binding protein, partial [Thermoanaerobaculia bacterium]|nr:AMP-binding protein [Thermoanaerobaculia bacterium]
RGDVALSGRPIALAAERAFHDLCLLRGATIAHAAPGATGVRDLLAVEPHVWSSDPTSWKVLLDALFEEVQRRPEWRQKIFRRAVKAARQAYAWRLRHRRPPGFYGAQLAVIDRLFFAEFRARLGRRFRFALSGGSRLPHGWITFLWSMGIPVYEGYGSTETAGVAALNTPQSIRPGTAGAPLPGVELRIAEDGEILVRGPNVAASEAGPDGFFRTGDSGWIDDAGMLELLGAKADLAPDATGKRIAPAPLESLLRASHFVAQAYVVVRGVPGALLVPNFEELALAARRFGLPAGTPDELIAHPRLRALFADDVSGINARLPERERIRVWDLLPSPFTLEADEITWTGSLRRPTLAARHAGAIDRLFASTPAAG